ncbi:MAG: hypothetical protein ABI678_12025 [Kofleriaceae bacterium]
MSTQRGELRVRDRPRRREAATERGLERGDRRLEAGRGQVGWRGDQAGEGAPPLSSSPEAGDAVPWSDDRTCDGFARGDMQKS